MVRAVLVAVLAVAVGATGCGGSGKLGAQPSWRTHDEPRARSSSQSALVFAPGTPAVARYNDPAGTAHPTRLEQEVADAAREIATELKRPPPRLDPRLSAAVDELAQVAPADSQLAYELVEFALHRHGIIEPLPHLIVVWGEADESDDDILSSLETWLPEILGSPTGAKTRLGVGRAERDGGQVCYVIAFQASHLDTEPVPRVLPPGGGVTLHGQIHEPFEDPHVYVTRDDGSVEKATTQAGPGGDFSTNFSCGAHRGRQQIEITAIGASGSTVLANFPVWCGDQPPARFVVQVAADENVADETEAQAAMRMFELINTDRRRAGLPPVEIDARLSQVAHAHSVEMRDTGRVAHVSPITGAAVDRVERAGIHTSVVLENVARSYGVVQAESGLMNSPGHRANILDAQINRVGLGLVFGDQVGENSRELFVTQLFARLPVDMPVAEATRLVATSVTRARGSLKKDPLLSAVAAELAQRVARGESADSAGARASQRLRRERSSYLSVATVLTAVADPRGFDPRTELTDPHLTSFGVGVARGNHPVMGDGAYFIVVLLGQK